MKEGCRQTCVENYFVDLFGSQYLFEIYHTSFNVKIIENVVESGDGEHYFFK